MAFKDEWTPQDDTMPADASVVNMIADEVIRIGEEGGGGNVDVVDNLNSTNTTKALSANQGRILNDKKLDAGDRHTYVSNVALFDVMDFGKELVFLDKDGNDAVRILIQDFLSGGSLNLITSGAVYKAIGDIDTALENIITKYGLGGDSV